MDIGATNDVNSNNILEITRRMIKKWFGRVTKPNNTDKAEGKIRTKRQGSNLSVNPADCADPLRSSLTCAHGHHTMLLIHC